MLDRRVSLASQLGRRVRRTLASRLNADKSRQHFESRFFLSLRGGAQMRSALVGAGLADLVGSRIDLS